MKSEVRRQRDHEEYWFEEGCYIIETANDERDGVCSIARARVPAGTTTAWHLLEGIAERYIIVAGTGRVEVGASLCCDVVPGDVVRIPENTRQRISCTSEEDLVFFAVCTPPFVADRYVSLHDHTE